MTKFVIFTLPRTGSTLLSKSLNKHPEIFCDDEIFHFSFRDYFSAHQFRFWKIRFLSKKVNYIINYPGTFFRLKNYLDEFYTNAPNEDFKARGFKLMFYQTKYTPGLLSYLKKNNVKVILLLRENILRNALSDLRARSTGIYHNESQIEPVLSGLPKLHVNTGLLQKKMNSITDQNKKLADVVKDMDHTKIRYEDFADWDNTMNRLTDFLNVSRQKLSAGTKKLNPGNLKDMIENYDEVENWLKQNSYAEFMG
jgi:LPS sulfotransferase NodH